MAEFKEKFGATNCKELTSLNLKTDEGLKEYFTKVHDYACVDRVKFAVQKGLEIL